MIVYEKLGDYLQSQNMKYADLQREIGISPTVTAKFQKNRPLNKVCEYLKVQPGDIMEWISDEEYEKANAEKLAIEKQIAELQAKLKNM